MYKGILKSYDQRHFELYKGTIFLDKTINIFANVGVFANDTIASSIDGKKLRC